MRWLYKLQLFYNYYNKNKKKIAINLSKQQALDANTKVRHQIKFTGNLNRGQDGHCNTTMFFINGGAKEIILDFSKGSVKVL